MAKQEGTIFKLKDSCNMTATATHPHIEAGKHFTVHPMQKEKLLTNGWAVEGHVKIEATAKTKKSEATV